MPFAINQDVIQALAPERAAMCGKDAKLTYVGDETGTR